VLKEWNECSLDSGLVAKEVPAIEGTMGTSRPFGMRNDAHPVMLPNTMLARAAFDGSSRSQRRERGIYCLDIVKSITQP
jgi:hypothetical protein